MKKFVSKKIVAVLTGNLISLLLIAGGAYLFKIGSELLQMNFVVGILLVSLLPGSLFLSALVYQRYVVGNCRQLSVVDNKECGHIQKAFLLALKDGFESARYVPMLLIALACASSFMLVSPIIGRGIIEHDVISIQLLGCLIISGQFLLGIKAYNLTVNAYSRLTS